MKEQIKEYLINQLDRVYCDTCNAEDCEDCYRKYMNWGISENYAECLADKILSMVKGGGVNDSDK